jgi:hypothetical protein
MKKRGEREKREREILEAFAMLGALAWQATVIKQMLFWCPGGRSHGG